MTAGRGIIHQEKFTDRFREQGGVMEMYHLWVNLPKKHKMTKAKYQAITKDRIPSASVASSDGTVDTAAEVRVVAGRYGDATGPASTFTPMNVLDVIVKEKNTP